MFFDNTMKTCNRKIDKMFCKVNFMGSKIKYQLFTFVQACYTSQSFHLLHVSGTSYPYYY